MHHKCCNILVPHITAINGGVWSKGLYVFHQIPEREREREEEKIMTHPSSIIETLHLFLAIGKFKQLFQRSKNV